MKICYKSLRRASPKLGKRPLLWGFEDGERCDSRGVGPFAAASVARQRRLCNSVSRKAALSAGNRGAPPSTGVGGMASDRARRLESAAVDASAPIDLVSRIQRIEQELSPAERRVAEAVVADYQGATLLSIGELARRAGVSQPSVTRFCRTVGCASFSELKVRLATTLENSIEIPVKAK